MAYTFFNIPIPNDDGTEDKMNTFLRENIILNVQKQLCAVQGSNLWAFCIEYIENTTSIDKPISSSKEKVDYRNLLGEEVFLRFEILRENRRQIANEEGIPAYAVFTNDELVEIANLSQITKENMLALPNISRKHIEKYAAIITKGL